MVDKRGVLDELELRVEVNEDIFSDQAKRLEAIQRKIRAEIESVLGISSRVTLVEPKTIARSEGKAKQVKDLRKKS